MHTDNSMNAQYERVIPRDLFNEGKLLKCIGHLVLLIHDGFGLNNLAFEHDGEPFKIALLDTGHLCITNVHFNIRGKAIFFKTLYNSKRTYPLYFEYDYCEESVFDEQGNYTPEFIEFCAAIR